MSRPVGSRADHLDAFAVLAADGLITESQAIKALTRRDYFSPASRRYGTPKPAGYDTARGMAWLVYESSMTYSEAQYVVATVIRGKAKAAIDIAMDSAGSVLSITLGELDRHRTEAGRDLRTAIAALTPKAIVERPQPRPADRPAAPGMRGL